MKRRGSPDRAEFWWDPKQPDEPVLFDSKTERGEKFFQKIIRHSVPLDMHILKALEAILARPHSLPLASPTGLSRSSALSACTALGEGEPLRHWPRPT